MTKPVLKIIIRRALRDLWRVRSSLGDPFPTGFRTEPEKLRVGIVFKKIEKPFPEKGTQQASEDGSTARKEVPMELDCSVQLPYAPQI